MRSLYINNEMENMEDYHILELFISNVIPRRDVKQVAYNIMNEFNNSLEEVINAPIERLMAVDGVGEVVAIEIKLINTILKRIERYKNVNVKYINSLDDAVMYCKNILACESEENVIMITLDNNGKILGCHSVSKGTVNESFVSKRDAVALALADNATNVLLAHNHPASNAKPSAADINMTINMRKLFRDVGIALLEHIIIGDDDYSFVLNSQGIK